MNSLLAILILPSWAASAVGVAGKPLGISNLSGLAYDIARFVFGMEAKHQGIGNGQLWEQNSAGFDP